MDLYLQIPVRHTEYKTLKLIENKNNTKFNTNKGNWIVIDEKSNYSRNISNGYKGSKKKGQYIINKIPNSVINYCKHKHVGRYIFDLKHRSSPGFTTLLCDTFEVYTRK